MPTDAEKSAELADLFKRGARGITPELLKVLPRPWDAPPRGEKKGKPAPYLVDDDLAAAAWVALLLRQPLLLTGDPGVGKTRYAEKLAGDLGLGTPDIVQVKSTTSGRDLLYRFEDLSRFRDATIAGAIARAVGGKDEGKGDGKGDADEEKRAREAADRVRRAQRPLVSYVRLDGLGRAILRAAGPKSPIMLESGFDRVEVFGAENAAKLENGKLTLADVFSEDLPDKEASPRHSVVLIDELDKAPRDTPNDLLGEIERMKFRFDELGFWVEADPDYKPLVVITSNAERNLPDAFLRRCVFHNIATPEGDEMCKIAAARLGGLDPNDALITAAWAFFDKVRARITEKKPGTAEFIALIAYLRARKAAVPLDDTTQREALTIFNKTKSDLQTAKTRQ